jgi:hypothetical protein
LQRAEQNGRQRDVAAHSTGRPHWGQGTKRGAAIVTDLGSLALQAGYYTEASAYSGGGAHCPTFCCAGNVTFTVPLVKPPNGISCIVCVFRADRIWNP